MNSSSATPGELTIMIAGAAVFVASFLPFVGDRSAWAGFFFPLSVLLPAYGLVMATQIAIAKFAKVRFRPMLGFTWEQLHLVLGSLAAIMAVGWFVTDVGKRGAGLWIEVVGGIALAFGAVNLQRERNTGVF
jgi:hypothetical protein